MEERRGEAASRARANLVLDAIIKAEELEASEADINERVRGLMERFKAEDGSLEETRARFAADGRLDMIKHEIRYRKAIDLLVDNANIVEITEEQAAEKALKAVAQSQDATGGPQEEESGGAAQTEEDIPVTEGENEGK